MYFLQTFEKSMIQSFLKPTLDIYEQKGISIVKVVVIILQVLVLIIYRKKVEGT